MVSIFFRKQIVKFIKKNLQLGVTKIQYNLYAYLIRLLDDITKGKAIKMYICKGFKKIFEKIYKTHLNFLFMLFFRFIFRSAV